MTELPLLSLLAGAFAGSALCAYVATPVVARLAERIGSVDHPGGRHAHLRPTPRLGGLAVMGALALGAAIFAAFLAVTGGLESVVATLWRDELVAFVLPCALVFVVGFVDDVRGLSPSTKLVVEAVAASFLIQRGFVIDVVANPVGQPIELGIFAFPVTLLWFVGITNAHNLVDGLDGLLGSIAVTALAGCAVVAVLGDRVASATLAVALAGALVGFLRWNWHPARIFLGDSGSLLIGFTIAALTLKVARNPFGTLALHVPLLVCALPIAETTLTLARRYVTGQPYFSGDRSHIHHVLVNRGLSVPQAVLSLAGIAALFCGAAVLSRLWRNDVALGAALGTLLLAAAGLRWVGYLELRVIWVRLVHAVRRGRRAEFPPLLALARAGELIKGARTVPELLVGLAAAAKEARLTFIAVEHSPRLAEALGEHALHLDCQCPLAHEVARRERPGLWVFSSEEPSAQRGEHEAPAVTHTVPFDLGDGLGGLLVFHRFVDECEPASVAQALRDYLAEPFGRALAAALEGVATAARRS